MVVVAVESVTSDLDHTVDISGFLDLNQTANIAELGAHASCCGVLAELSDKLLRFAEELNSVLDTGGEECVELITTPLDAMLNLVREVSKRAHRNGLLRRIL